MSLVRFNPFKLTRSDGSTTKSFHEDICRDYSTTLPLHLPSGLVLDQNNCYLVLALSMNIISGSCLVRDGYSFKSENNGCSIYMSNIFYGHAPLKSGLFFMNLDSSDTQDRKSVV